MLEIRFDACGQVMNALSQIEAKEIAEHLGHDSGTYVYETKPKESEPEKLDSKSKAVEKPQA